MEVPEVQCRPLARMESIPEEAPSGGVGQDYLSCKKCKLYGPTQFFKVASSSSGGDRELEFHKCPITASSKYLIRVLLYSSRFLLPSDFPGGLSAFEATVGFCLGKGPELDPSNVVVIRCAAEYLEMDREVMQAEWYLTQVVLRQWTATMVVLRSCFESREVTVIADSDDVAIVARCVDALALMIKAEFERQSLGRTRAAAVVQVPFSVFRRVIDACKVHGLGDEAIGELLAKYARRWLFSVTEKGEQELEQWPASQLADESQIIEPLVSLLPEKPGAVPVGFLFDLLRYAILMEAEPEFIAKEIQTRITPQLPFATIDDILSPFWDEPELLLEELEVVRRMVAEFMSLHEDDDGLAGERVASLWDGYLGNIACSSLCISARAFVDLLETVPDSFRPSHDQLYEAIHVFLKAHPLITYADRAAIFDLLDLRKLSSQACSRAVQDETLRMPLRKMVRARMMPDIYRKAMPDRQDELLHDYQDEDQDYALGEATAADVFQMAVPRAQEIKADLEAAALKLDSLEKEVMVLRKALTKESKASSNSHGGTKSSSSYSSSSCTNESNSSSRSGSSSSRSGLGRKLTNALSAMRLCRDTSRAATAAPAMADPGADPVHCRPRRPVYSNRIEVDHDVAKQEELKALLKGGCLS